MHSLSGNSGRNTNLFASFCAIKFHLGDVLRSKVHLMCTVYVALSAPWSKAMTAWNEDARRVWSVLSSTEVMSWTTVVYSVIKDGTRAEAMLLCYITVDTYWPTMTCSGKRSIICLSVETGSNLPDSFVSLWFNDPCIILLLCSLCSAVRASKPQLYVRLFFTWIIIWHGLLSGKDYYLVSL